MLKPGDTAPCFTLPDADMEPFCLEAAYGKQVTVLFFYPRSKAPICARLIEQFSDYEPEFVKQGCIIVGISPEDSQSHINFREEEGVTLRLLSDASTDVCTQYGVWHEKEVDGIRKMGAQRALFVIDSHGVVQCAEYDLDAHLHASEVLQWVKQLRKT